MKRVCTGVYVCVCVLFVCMCGPTVSLPLILLLSSLLYLLRNTILSPLNQSVRKKITKSKETELASLPVNQLNPVCQLDSYSLSAGYLFHTAVCVDPVSVQFVTVGT